MTINPEYGPSGGNSTRGLFGIGGESPSVAIDYITIDTTGNGTDFGDLSTNSQQARGTSNDTRFVRCGGISTPSYNNVNIMEYVTIASTGNAVDLGDMANNHRARACTSNGHGGL